MTRIGRFVLKEQEMEEYSKILSEFGKKQNYHLLNFRIVQWCKKYNRKPSFVYRNQLKVFK